MKYFLRKAVTRIERRILPLIGKILWPPTGVNVVCWTSKDREELILLDIDGNYNLPAGMIEQGEHPREASEREFKEETGLNLEIENFLGVKTAWNGISGLHFFYEAILTDNFEKKTSGWEGEPKIIDKEEISGMLEKLPSPKET